MAEIKLPDIRPAKTIEEKVDALYDAYFMLRKHLNYAFSGILDEDNVIRAQEANIANLLAGKITADQIDVTQGKIQAAQIEDLIVGDNVIMGANATISWNQVTGTEQIPLRTDLAWDNLLNKPTNLLTQSQLTEALTNYVTTGQMTEALADTLNLGNFSTIITKDYIASMNLVVGREILMGANARLSWLNIDDKPFIPATAADVGAISSTYIDANNVFTLNVYGENIRGNVISTANFNGTGNYIQMQRQYLTFWDANNNAIKMALGFLPDNSGVNVPAIVFGAGDGRGNNRGYITKDTDSLDIFFIDSAEKVSAVKLQNGKIYLNNTEIPAFDPDNPLPYEYLQNGEKWNNTLAKIQASGNIDWTLMLPPTAEQVGARPDTWMPTADDVGAISSTYIDENGVFTPQVYATNINVLRGKITTAQIEDLVVGGNVTMGPNATISWSKITDRPTIPSQYTDEQALKAWKKSGYATWIDANGVYSGAFNGGMFNINPTGDPYLESGLTIGGWYNNGWIGQAFKMQYDPYGNGSFPGTIVSSVGGVPLIFELSTYFDYYVRFRSGSDVSFRGNVDFTGANVTGLSAVAVFG